MISESITIEEIEASADQLSYVPEILRKQFEEHYKAVDDKTFMLGLISGYINAYTLLKSNEVETTATNQIGALIAFLSDKYLKMN